MFETSKISRKRNPREKANIFSRLTFLYTSEIFTKSKYKDLEEDDVYTIVNNCRSDVAGDVLETQWEKELKKENTSLIRTLVCLFGWEYTFYGLLSFIIKTPLLAITPYATGILVSYFETSSTTTQDNAIWCGCILIASGIVDAIFINYYKFALQRLALRIEVSICALIYRKALKLTAKSLREMTSGRIMTLIAKDSMAVSSASLLFLHDLWIGVLQVAIVMGIMYHRVGPSTMVGIGFFMSAIPIQMWIGVKIKEFLLKTLALTDERLRRIQEILTSIRLIKFYCWEAYFDKIVHSIRIKEMLMFRNTLFLRATILSLSSLSYRVSYFLCVFAYYMLGNNISAEELFFLVTCYKSLDSLLSNTLPTSITWLAEGRCAAERFQTFLLMEERENQKCHQGGGGIKMKGVCVKIADDKLVLNEVNVELARPCLIGITGEVGTGKTTFLKTLMRDVRAFKGMVLMTGGVSFASQEPWLFPGTIRQNVLFGNRYDPSRYHRVLKVCGLVEDLEDFPEHDSTVVIDRGLNLSKGQQARVNLARAVYKKADVYLLDDVLSSLDLNVSKYVFVNCIKGFLKDKLCLLVCHHADFLASADKVVKFKDASLQIIDNDHVKTQINDNFQGRIDHIEEVSFDREIKDASAQKIDNQDHTEEGSDGKLRCDHLKELNDHQCIPRETRETRISDIEGRFDGERIDASIQKRRFDRQDDNIHQEEHKEEITANQGRVFYREEDVMVDHQKKDEHKKLYKELKVSGKVHRKVYFKYFQYAGGWRKILPVLLLCLVAQSIGIVFDFYANQWLEVEAKMIETLYKTETGVDSTEDLESERRRVMSLYAGILAVFACFIVIEYFSFFAMVVRASRNVHLAVFKRIMGATMNFFDTHFSGSIVNRFSRDMGGVDGCGPYYLDCVKTSLELAVVISLIIYLNPILCIPALMFFLVLLYGAMRFVQASRSLRRMEVIVRAPCIGFLNASLEGLTTINAFGNREILKAQFDRHQSHYSGVVFMIFTTKSAVGLWLTVIGNLFSACIIFSFITFHNKLENIAGDVGVAVTQAIGISALLQSCVIQWAEMENGMTSVERVLEYENAEQEELAGESPLNWPKNPKIEYKNVTMKYTDSNINILQGLTFTIEPRQKIGIIGRTGAGKSSIISALFRLYQSEGHISIDDFDTSKLKLSILRSKISIIPQDPIMFKGTVRSNLDPYDLLSDFEIWNALEKVGLKNIAGLNDEVEEGGLNWSIGQRQLFSLARVLLANNKIVVFDEATSNMDPETDGFIRGMVGELFADCTVVTIAHRIDTIMGCDKIMVIEGGDIVESGDTGELLETKMGYFNSIVKRSRNLC